MSAIVLAVSSLVVSAACAHDTTTYVVENKYSEINYDVDRVCTHCDFGYDYMNVQYEVRTYICNDCEVSWQEVVEVGWTWYCDGHDIWR